MIRWVLGNGAYSKVAYGYVRDTYKYYVGYLPKLNAMGVDANLGFGIWTYNEIVVESIEEGIQICEMWEATGAY